jgi:hypothetical protein
MNIALLASMRMRFGFDRISSSSKLFMLLLLAILPWTASSLRSQTAADQHPNIVASSVLVDPDKASSELNHHVAGLLLVTIGILVIVSSKYKGLAPIQKVWPFLFIVAGLFLAVWSDSEIWPRGDLSWTWLLRHDAEARQHKIYAILLLAIGTIEYLRSRAKLPQQCARWAFPILAVFGGVLLFFHDHGGSHGGSVILHHGDHQPASADQLSSAQPESAIKVIQASATSSGHESQHQHALAAEAGTSLGPEASDRPARHHEHQMSAAMLNIRREHMWFAAMGFCIALCKFLYDANFLSGRISPYLWANSMIVLGVLLVLYTE